MADNETLVEEIAQHLELFRPHIEPWSEVPEARKAMRRSEAHALLSGPLNGLLRDDPADQTHEDRHENRARTLLEECKREDTTGKVAVIADALASAEIAGHTIGYSRGSREASAELITHLQEHRRATLRALRAHPDGSGGDYWRWQGHAELSRQLLERLGAEVPL